MQFSGVILFAKDMKAMTAFYRDVLGLEPVPEQPFDPKGFFQFGDPRGVTFSLHRGSKPNEGRAKLCFTVDDLAATHARLKAAKVKVGAYGAPTATDGGLLNLKDPEGNRVQLYGRAPRG